MFVEANLEAIKMPGVRSKRAGPVITFVDRRSFSGPSPLFLMIAFSVLAVFRPYTMQETTTIPARLHESGAMLVHLVFVSLRKTV